jgi:hypothetical protein
MGSLAKQVEDSGLRPFTKKELSLAADLFADRAALFLTPTETLPSRYIWSWKAQHLDTYPHS